MNKIFTRLWLPVVAMILSFASCEKVSATDNKTPEENEPELTENTINGHEYVDLGVPSGLKWATCNVGATTPEEHGDYFAWGETASKTEYTEDNCTTWGTDISDISGNATYDAARANWGGSWRMPTKAEMEELIENCTWTWTAQNGVNGVSVVGANGNNIFLPAAGGYEEPTICSGIGSFGCYWTSTSGEDNEIAYYLLIRSDDYIKKVRYFDRYGGMTVRPISE